MWIERKVLAQEIPAVVGLDTRQVCELLAALGFPVDGVERVGGTTVLAARRRRRDNQASVAVAS